MAPLLHRNVLSAVVTLLKFVVMYFKVLNINVTFIVMYFSMLCNPFLTLLQEAAIMRAL